MANTIIISPKGNTRITFHIFKLESGQNQYEVTLWGKDSDVTITYKDRSQAELLYKTLVSSEDIVYCDFNC